VAPTDGSSSTTSKLKEVNMSSNEVARTGADVRTEFGSTAETVRVEVKTEAAAAVDGKDTTSAQLALKNLSTRGRSPHRITLSACCQRILASTGTTADAAFRPADVALVK
jgi:hypothetical protein